MANVNLSAVSEVLYSQTILNRPIRIATFGDSTASIVNGGVTDFLTGAPAWGQIENYSLTVLPIVSSFPCLVVADGGINGQTTAQIKGRSASVFSSTRKAVTDVKALNPDIVLLQGGSINDVTGFDATTPQATIDAVAQRHIEIALSFVNDGIPVLDPCIYGYSVAVEATKLAAIRAAIVRINGIVKEEASKHRLWRFCDVEGIISIDGAFIPEMTTDLVHLNTAGGYALASLYNPIIEEMFAGQYRAGVLKYDSEYHFANPVSGIPANHAFGASGTLTVNSKVSDSTRCVVNVTTTNPAGEEFLVYINNVINTVLTGALSVNKFAIRMGMELRQNGVLIPCEYSGRVWLKDTAQSQNLIRAFASAYCNGKFSSLLPFAMPADASAMNNSSAIYYGIKMPSAGTYDITIYPDAVYTLA